MAELWQVCFAVWRNQNMRTVTNVFIVNLAVGDFLVILLCLPPTLVQNVSLTWFLGAAMCKTLLFLQVGGPPLRPLVIGCPWFNEWSGSWLAFLLASSIDGFGALLSLLDWVSVKLVLFGYLVGCSFSSSSLSSSSSMSLFLVLFSHSIFSSFPTSSSSPSSSSIP